MPGYASIVRCPVDGCEWSTQIPEPARLLQSLAPPQVQLRQQRIEDALLGHSVHHSPLEYLRTIQRLKRDLAMRPPLAAYAPTREELIGEWPAPDRCRTLVDGDQRCVLESGHPGQCDNGLVC